jgi:ATP-dependent 26S proteasome regulatory subunit
MCTEAGLEAMREETEAVSERNFMAAVAKIRERGHTQLKTAVQSDNYS